MPVQQPFKLASREVRRDSTEVRIDGVTVGGGRVVVMAGPVLGRVARRRCARWPTRSRRSGAQHPARRGVQAAHLALRLPGAEGAGAPATSREARKRTGLPVVTEVLETESVELVAEYADVLQIGARNIQNFTLLRAGGARCGKPVLLKRGMATTHPGVPAVGRVHPRRAATRT